MTRRERLMATLRGEPVDRPAVSFYEINGLDQDPDDLDPFSIYSHPSWRALIELARDRTDRIVMRGVSVSTPGPDPVREATRRETVERDGSRYTVERVLAGDRMLTRRTRRDRDIDTVWTEEHLLKDADDLRAYLSLLAEADPAAATAVDTAPVHAAEEAIGESGIVMVDTADPLCLAASLFSMEEYTVIALTERRLFHELLERLAVPLLEKTRAVSAALPGRLWRIYGPEYASPPYLPPFLFREYVCRYVEPMVRAIQHHGGYARVHSHGNLRDILDDIAAMGVDGLDPIEPPSQGDVELREVRERHGRQMVLFGNIEASDLETLPTSKFADKVERALAQGTAGTGRGFVLMPSSCPYGRELSLLAVRNYETMVDLVER